MTKGSVPRTLFSAMLAQAEVRNEADVRPLCTLLIGVLFAQIPQSGKALELSESSLAIMTHDSVAPAEGTLTLVGLSYALPAGAQTVAGVHSPGNVVLLVRGRGRTAAAAA